MMEKPEEYRYSSYRSAISRNGVQGSDPWRERRKCQGLTPFPLISEVSLLALSIEISNAPTHTLPQHHSPGIR